jgi:hypothetical protein
MTIQDRIENIDLRIQLLKSRDPVVNAKIISKQERKKRALLKQLHSN